MAKKKAPIKVDSPSPTLDTDYQARDDAHDVMRYASLRNNKERHDRAMKLIMGAAELEPRKARKMSRKSSRGAGRH
jgi:hypothetical protein